MRLEGTLNPELNLTKTFPETGSRFGALGHQPQQGGGFSVQVSATTEKGPGNRIASAGSCSKESN